MGACSHPRAPGKWCLDRGRCFLHADGNTTFRGAGLMHTNRWCLWISEHSMSFAGCRAAAGLAGKLRHGSQVR